MADPVAIDKEPVSWWFRRISTTLAIANGGAIVALAGFAGNAKSISMASAFLYPSIMFFFSGAFSAFFSFMCQFVYAFTGLDGYAERDEQRIKEQKKNKEAITINWPATICFGLYAVALSVLIFYSGYSFYRGARAIVVTTNAIACKSVYAGPCKSVPSFFFPKPGQQELAVAAKLDAPDKDQAGAQGATVARTPAAAAANEPPSKPARTPPASELAKSRATATALESGKGPSDRVRHSVTPHPQP